MRRILAAAAVGAAAVLALATPAHADTSLLAQVNGLTVAAEHTSGYDRDLFGNYDRTALIAANLAAWPACDGYYSQADDECYTAASEVDVDHIVALKEAWDSGAYAWSDAQLDTYPGDTANLWLMTDNLNQSKGEQDFAEWTPPAGAALCGYLTRYVAVKVEWHLAVDSAEKTALLAAAEGCDAAPPATEPPPAETCHPAYAGACLPTDAKDVDCGDLTTQVRVVVPGVDPFQLDNDGDGVGCESLPPAPKPSAGEPASSTPPAQAGGTGGSGSGDNLPVTGTPVLALTGAGVGLAAVGLGAWWVARRRRVRFTA